ncbi:aminoglycoside phosphotransferase family protein [Naasia lichenicola]|uniref:Aminoglycoside resistance protein n=1 Tax=Naasia lichenicola TaxID=2565933 RepID=A0A4V3WST5_9MICO|nr:aminoglycoside phosphotransferase family protein [Naasia lichenicola]THG29357.1 aminoglycoside resistance protein [Naasia lichenicola]
MSVSIPSRLVAHAADPRWAGWLDRLPRLIDDLLGEWQLTTESEPVAGTAAIVLPVRTGEGEATVLKVSWPHWEAETEHLALRYWAGDGAVRLLRADPRRFALLLERADDRRDLRKLRVREAIEVVASLYPRLHRTPPPQLRTLSWLAADWAERLPRLIAHGGMPRRIVEHAVSLARDFSRDPATDGTLIHTDLHYENVLGSLRDDARQDHRGWLVIDPKPLSGDPCYEVGPLLGNRWDELVGADLGANLRGGVLDRLYTAVDAAGLDEDRTRDWSLVREVVRVLWAVEEDALEKDDLDRAVTIAKAMQR